MRKYLNAWREMCVMWQNFIATPKFKNAFIWGIVLYGLALFALIRGDIYYVDDLGSSIRNQSWNQFSRYLATFILGGVITFGKGTIDLSPLPQILGAIFIVASSLILLYLICKKYDLLGIVASLPLGLSPHFLQNLSHKFDSLSMSMALFFAIVPFLFKENKRIFVVVSIASLFCMFMLYQAANGTYIVLSVYFAFSAYFLEKRKFKESAIFLAICAMNLVVSSLLHGLTLNTNYFSVRDSYVSQEIIPLDSHFFVGIWANLAIYLTTIFNDLKQMPYIWLVALNCVLFVVKVAICTNRPKILAICGAILFLVLGICLSYGLYVVLQKPLFLPRAFYGFNAFVAILCIANVSILDSSRYCTKNDKVVNLCSTPPHSQKISYYTSCAVAVIMAYFLISFANIYGNALKKQDKYLEFRNSLLLKDLSKIVPRGSNFMVYIEPYVNSNHPVTQRFMDKYGNISRVMPKVYIHHHFFVNGYNYDIDGLCLSAQLSGEVVLKNTYHTIEKVKSCYIVTQN